MAYSLRVGRAASWNVCTIFPETPMTLRLSFSPLSSSRHLVGTVLLGMAGAACLPAVADAPQVLFKGPHATITTDDIQAETAHLPADTRQRLLSRPDQVGQLAENLFIQRTLAAQAREQKLDQTTEVQTRLQLAKERIEAALVLDKLKDEAALSPQNREKYARSIYKAEPEKFRAPADTRASHILILSKTEGAKEKIDGIYAQLQKGADFAALAKEHSQDPRSAENGGDLGFFTKGRMVAEFEHAVEQLKKPGEWSKPFLSHFGWHIARLEERRPERPLPFEEVRERLEQEGNEAAFRSARTAVTEAIKDKATPDFEAIEAFSKAQATPDR